MTVDLPTEGTARCACWEAELEEKDAEGVLARTREQNPGVVVQLFGASRPPNLAAVEMIAAQTLAARRSGATLADRPEVDLLLRLAGTRQIGEAFRRAGYRSGKRLFMVAACEGDEDALRRLAESAARDGRFGRLEGRELTKGDLEQVERAALLSAGL